MLEHVAWDAQVVDGVVVGALELEELCRSKPVPTLRPGSWTAPQSGQVEVIAIRREEAWTAGMRVVAGQTSKYSAISYGCGRLRTS